MSYIYLLSKNGRATLSIFCNQLSNGLSRVMHIRIHMPCIPLRDKDRAFDKKNTKKPFSIPRLMLPISSCTLIPSFSPPKQVRHLELSLREAEDRSEALRSRLEEEEEAKRERLEEIKGGQKTSEDLKQKESQQSEIEDSQKQDEQQPKNLRAPKTFVRYQVLFCPQLFL